MLPETIESLKNQRENFEVKMVASSKITGASEEGVTVDGKDYGVSDWGFKTLLRRFKIPVSFYASLSHDIQNRVWTYAIKMAPEERSFSQLILQKDTREIHGVVSQDYSSLLTETVLESIPENWKMVLGDRANLFDPVCHFRFIDESKDVSDKTFVGFDINSSEVGGTQFIIEALLYREVCSNGLFAARKLPAGYASFVKLPYEGLSHELTRAIATNLSKAMCSNERVAFLSECVDAAKSSRLNIGDYLDSLLLQADKSFAKRVAAVTEDEIISSNFELAMVISNEAKGLPLRRARKFESEAGMLLNLTIEESAY